MNNKKYLIVILLFFLVYSLYVTFNVEKKQTRPYHDENPAHTEETEDGLYKVVLSSMAAERLDIQTLSVNKTQRTIPYSSITYDIYGKTWVYENIEPFTYIRRQVSISGVNDSQAILSEYLQNDMVVVTVGVPELDGVEYGIGQGGAGH